MEKIAVLAPMPSASVRMAAAANPGERVQPAKRVLHVTLRVPHVVPPACASFGAAIDVLHVVAGVVEVPELAARLVPRLRPRHPRGDQFFDAGLEMKPHFGIHVFADVGGRSPDELKDSSHRAHGQRGFNTLATALA